MASSPGTIELGPGRCRELLGDGGVGRLAFCDGGRPVVLPVNYVVVDDSLLVRTGAGAKAGAAARGDTVAFQVDDLAPEDGAPWSVLVTGSPSLLSEEELGDALAHDLEPAAGSFRRDLFIRIGMDDVTGRRLDGFGPLGR